MIRPKAKNKNKCSADKWYKKVHLKLVLIISFIILIIVLPITLLSINWANISILYATGSSAVFPLMKELSATYQAHHSANLPSIDLSIEATGSGSGIEKILSNNTNLGNISFSPSLDFIKQNNYYNQWNSLEIKTISWGIDGISLVYYGNFNLDINEKNISNLYIAFSGLKPLTYQSLGVVNTDIKISPYARTGGANKSGTTEAFIKNSGFKLNAKNPELNDALNKIQTGQYGKNVNTTKESQSETWHQMSIHPFAGQIAYLSTGFVLENKQEIINAGYKIATYKNNELNKQNIQNGAYNWRRILNSLISIKHLEQNLKLWVEWVLLEHYNDAYIKQTFDKIGIVQFNNEQIKQMFDHNNNFWVSDFTLNSFGVRLKE